jgi:hypothetical protein
LEVLQHSPKPRFALKSGTIFEDSPLPLEKWLPAVWMLLNSKNGISNVELHRDLGVTQKTASPEFSTFREGMKKTLEVSKAEIDERVRIAKIESPRTGNPNAPGRKRTTKEQDTGNG